MRCYTRLLNISYKDYDTNAEICRKIQSAIGEMMTPGHGQGTTSKVVRPRLKVLWFSKDNPAGHSERKQKR